MPLIQIFDVDIDLSEKELKNCLCKQDLEYGRVTETQVREEVKFRFRSGRKGEGVCNLDVESPLKIRDKLVSRGRIYIDCERKEQAPVNTVCKAAKSPVIIDAALRNIQYVRERWPGKLR